MDSVVVLVPDSLSGGDSGYLYGFRNGTAFYVVGLSSEEEDGSLGEILGFYASKEDELCLVPRRPDWIVVSQLGNGRLRLRQVFTSGVVRDLPSTRLVIYDKSGFSVSELFLPKDFVSSESEKDYFKKLSFSLKEVSPRNRSCVPHQFINSIIWLFSWINFFLIKALPVLRFSTTGLHLTDCSTNLLWMLRTYKKEDKITLQTANYALSIVVDVLCGYFVLHFLTKWSRPEEIYNFMSVTTESIVTSLIILVEWLMGSPAGLKLNHPLNQILGGFFLYNINLWWAFLGMVRPVLEFSYFIFLTFGLMGLTFQIAIIADVFTIVTFHVYCIYIYAARLYELQVSGLWSLSRLVLGRNRNPEPGRVDSCPYTTEQLFVGTISFTVLLFLLPTTLVYYVVFVIMRLGINLISGLMARARYLMQALPLYTTFVWFFCPSYTTMTMKITPEKCSNRDDAMVFIARPVCSSWFTTVKYCVPEIIKTPPPVKWLDIIKIIATGKLFYSL